MRTQSTNLCYSQYDTLQPIIYFERKFEKLTRLSKKEGTNRYIAIAQNFTKTVRV